MSEAKTDPSKPDPEAAKPRINLDDEEPTRDTVQVDGKFYEIARLDDFGIFEQQKLDRDGREFSALWTSMDQLTDDQGKRLKMLLDRIFDKLLPDAPKAVKAKFKDAKRAELVLGFSVAPARDQMFQALAAQLVRNAQSQEARVDEPVTAS